jgi:hypothetical protein
MKKGYTHISANLDRSGSMIGIIDDMKGGFLTFLEEQKKVEGDITLSVSIFDTQYDKICEFVDVRTTDLDLSTYTPRGGTALRDSLAKLINETGAKIASMNEEDRPEKVILISITDGQENASTEISAEQLKEMIKHQEDVYNWQVVYLGANQDSYAAGSAIGIRSNSTMNFMANTDGINAMYASLSTSTSNYRNATLSTEQLDLNTIKKQ